MCVYWTFPWVWKYNWRAHHFRSLWPYNQWLSTSSHPIAEDTPRCPRYSSGYALIVLSLNRLFIVFNASKTHSASPCDHPLALSVKVKSFKVPFAVQAAPVPLCMIYFFATVSGRAVRRSSALVLEFLGTSGLVSRFEGDSLWFLNCSI